MMIIPKDAEKYKNSTYEYLIQLRDETLKQIHDFEENGADGVRVFTDEPTEFIYADNLYFVSRLCEYIADKYQKKEYGWSEKQLQEYKGKVWDKVQK